MNHRRSSVGEQQEGSTMKVDRQFDPKHLLSLLRGAIGRSPGRGALLALVAMLSLVVALAGCGGGGSSSSSSSSESGSSTSAEEAPATEEETEPEEEEEEGESVNAAGYAYAGTAKETAEAKTKGAEAAGTEEAPPSEKTIGVIQLSAESATSVLVAEAAEQIGEMFGYSVNVCDPELEEQKFAECATSILAQNPSVIFSTSTNAAAFGSAVKDAESKGIPWFNVGSSSDKSTEVNNYGIDGFEMAEVLDEYMFEAMRKEHPGGEKLKLFAITAPTVGTSSLNSETELKKNAEEAGDVEVIIHNLDLANAPQDTLTSSRQTLERNPELAGMWTLCDFCLPLMAQTVQSDPEASNVVVAGEFSNPQAISDIRKGTIAAVADYAWALPVWVGMDQVLANWTKEEEIKQGFGVFAGYPLPFMKPYLLTKENVGTSGPVPVFGPDFEAFFEEKWGKEYGVG
jgi:ABC-type sugar transport system substrate-binding protein